MTSGSRIIPAAAATLIATLAATAPVGAAPGVPRTRVLPNGMKIVTVEDHTLPLVAASLWVGAGSKHEIESSAGYAHFLEHLIQRGTKTSKAFEYQRLANRWGGSLTVRSNYDRTHLTGTAVPGSAADLIASLADMAFNATLTDEEIDAELGTLSMEIRSHYDDPASVAFLETMRAAFRDHPYRVPLLGNFRTVGRLKRPPIAAFHRNLYVPNNMALAVAGDFTTAALDALIDRAFGGASKSATLPAPPDAPSTFPGHDDIEKRLKVQESWITVSFVGPGYRHPDRPAMEVLARAIADERLVPMRAALRGEGAGTEARVSYYGLEDAGLIYAAAQPLNPLRSYAAATAIVGAIASFKERGLSESDLDAYVERLVSEERIRTERLAERAERLGEAALFGGARYYWDLPIVYERLTVEDIARVAAKYLVVDNLRLVIMVPEKTRPFTDQEKDRFHKVLDGLGKARPGFLPGFGAARYSAREADRITSDAWGHYRDAARPPEPIRATLDNGLTVIVLQDRRHSLTAASLHLPFGSANDPPGREGLAFMAGRLLAQGSPDPVGGAGDGAAGSGPGGDEPDDPPPPASAPFDVQVGRDFSEARLLTTPERLRRSLEALAATIRSPRSGEDAVAAARAIALSAVERAVRDPAGVAMELFQEKVYAGSPYAHPVQGTRPGLEAVKRADLLRLFENHLRPSGAVLVIAGAVEPEEAGRMARGLFGAWRDSTVEGAGTAPAADPAAPPARRTGEFERMMNTPRSHLIVGVASAAIRDPDFAVIRQIGTALTVIGFEDIIFDRRAAFSLSAVPDGLRRAGSLSIGMQTAHRRRDEAVFDVQRLMRRLALEPLGRTDLADFARVQSGRETASLQGILSLASHIGFREVTGLDGLKFRDDLQIEPVPPAKVREVAGRYLDPGQWIVIKVGVPDA